MGTVIAGANISVHRRVLGFDVARTMPIMAPLLMRLTCLEAPVAELVDAVDSKSAVRTGVLVRVRPGAPFSSDRSVCLGLLFSGTRFKQPHPFPLFQYLMLFVALLSRRP